MWVRMWRYQTHGGKCIIRLYISRQHLRSHIQEGKDITQQWVLVLHVWYPGYHMALNMYLHYISNESKILDLRPRDWVQGLRLPGLHACGHEFHSPLSMIQTALLLESICILHTISYFWPHYNQRYVGTINKAELTQPRRSPQLKGCMCHSLKCDLRLACAQAPRDPWWAPHPKLRELWVGVQALMSMCASTQWTMGCLCKYPSTLPSPQSTKDELNQQRMN